MESTELRIGNLVNYQEGTSKKQGFIYCINYTTATVGNTIERYTVKLKNIEPIRLTEELLLKYGFGDITNECATKAINIKTFCKTFRVGKCTEQQTIFIELGSRGWTFKRVGYPLYNYFHQLQNLYFSLTGEELTITE